MKNLQGKEKIISILASLITVLLVTYVPSLEPMAENLGVIILALLSWGFMGAIVEYAQKRDE